ncbi:MAG: glycoside hydrolase family 2 [Clostridia bacterium]|nr:glycoside hydrolase family 2 [Clostridia bacterium]
MSWNQEYPRPMLKREGWLSLNGTWKVNGQEVQVPYPLQSQLSGWQGPVPEVMHYERMFRVPGKLLLPASRLMLHFGAVDQIACVKLNGREVIRHEGGYLPFSADVTDYVHAGENLLTVEARDTLDPVYPRGKQSARPGGMWYTPVSGIWQTVWLECVPEKHAIRKIRITPDTEGFHIYVDTDVEAVRLTVDGKQLVIDTGREVRVSIENAHLWSPEDPFLYAITLETDTDRVESYTALRRIEIRDNAGKRTVMLNGRPVFWNAVLDQGYFTDGIFLPGNPQEYDRDVLRMKDLGFNMLRKHIKIEPERFYEACDRLGMLVMQDMVSSGGYNFLLDTALPTIGLTRRPDCFPGDKKRKEFFHQHCVDTVEHLWNHPCVVAYTIFNEGWGQFCADEMYRTLKAKDPTRIWDATSGWFTRKESDLDSVHVYFRNKVLKGGGRPLFLSECGGYARAVEGHRFKEDGKYGYGTAGTEEALTERIVQLYREMVLPSIDNGLCGVVYTQLSDVEEEINGLYTYDRQVCKVDRARIRSILKEAEDRYGKH